MKSLLFFCILVLSMASMAHGEWAPPEKPSPTTILREAESDARAGRYEEALAKHLWYHENALKYDAGQTGVRLSFALSDWYDLGADYAPALAKFEEVRAAARKGALESEHPKHVRRYFIDFEAMSEKLRRENETVDLFVELREKNADDAANVYRRAEKALVKAGRFDLCGEFLDAERAMELEIKGYELNMKLAKEKNEERGKHLRSFGERSFRHAAATIVVILVKNGKVEEAKQVAQQARDAWDDQKLKDELDRALEGKTPKAFP